MKTILLVEDDDDLRELMTLILVEAGYRVTEARDGREALETIDRAPLPDLVLLDLMMPVLSGDDVLRALRAGGATATLPVVAVSAIADRYRPPGADAYVQKPLLADDLLTVVRRFVP